MVRKTSIYQAYRNELFRAYPQFGYALWEPRPEEQSPPIEIGDVGYVKLGQFHRLFNILLPGSHESHRRFNVPEGHEPMELSVTDHPYFGPLQPMLLKSYGVSLTLFGVEVRSPMAIGTAGLSVLTTKQRGAVLSYSAEGRRADTHLQSRFKKWMAKNIDSWLTFTEQLGMDLRMEDIVLVTGHSRVESFSILAFNEAQTDTRMSLGVDVAGVQANVNYRNTNLHIQGGLANNGPIGDNLPQNQCIFFRGFRVKRRVFRLFRKIAAAAEPEDREDHDGEPEEPMVTIPHVAECPDPLHLLLDHILHRTPECEMAIVHDDDLGRLLGAGNESPLPDLEIDQIVDFLEKVKPAIGVTAEYFSSSGQNQCIERVKVAMLDPPLQPTVTGHHASQLTTSHLLLVPSAQTTPPPHSKFINLNMFNVAWKAYEKRTNVQIVFHPLAAHLQMCTTPADVLTALESQVDQFDGSRSSDERLRKWLAPFVYVVYAFSEALGEGLTLTFSPGNVIFTSVGILFLTAKAVNASQHTLVQTFKHVEDVFRRLESYTNIPLTSAMAHATVQVMAEVLNILAATTEEIKKSRHKKYLHKLFGRTHSDGLAKLDKLSRELALMAL